MIKTINVKCNKCNTVFNTEHNLTRHINKIIPCIVTIQCTRCLKMFPKLQNLVRHNDRKFPCKISKIPPGDPIEFSVNDLSELSTQLQIAVEKTKKSEIVARSKLDIEAKKSENIESKKNSKLILIQEVSKRKELQLASVKEIEILKTTRKEQTAKIINNNVKLSILNNYIEEYTTKYLEVNYVAACQKDIEENLIESIMDNFSYGRATYLFKNHAIKEIIEIILMFYFNNEHYPNLHSIYYIRELDKFLAIIKHSNSKEIKEVDFDLEIFPFIKDILYQVFDKMLTYNSNIRNIFSFDDTDIEFIEKYNNLVIFARILCKNQTDIKKYAKFIFDENNILDMPRFLNE